jgi:hypothetical protein
MSNFNSFWVFKIPEDKFTLVKLSENSVFLILSINVYFFFKRKNLVCDKEVLQISRFQNDFKLEAAAKTTLPSFYFSWKWDTLSDLGAAGPLTSRAVTGPHWADGGAAPLTQWPAGLAWALLPGDNGLAPCCTVVTHQSCSQGDSYTRLADVLAIPIKIWEYLEPDVHTFGIFRQYYRNIPTVLSKCRNFQHLYRNAAGLF